MPCRCIKQPFHKAKPFFKCRFTSITCNMGVERGVAAAAPIHLLVRHASQMKSEENILRKCLIKKRRNSCSKHHGMHEIARTAPSSSVA